MCLAFATYMTRDINDTSVTNPRMTGKPSFAGSWRTTILISHIQHKTICLFLSEINFIKADKPTLQAAQEKLNISVIVHLGSGMSLRFQVAG